VTNCTFSGNSVWGGGSFQGNGGAIENSGTLTMSSSTLSGNSALDFGGAIDNTGTLTLTDSTFSGNTTTSNGGAISSTGTLMVTNSTFSGNSGGYEAAGGAGAIYNDGTMAVTGSTFSGNSGNYGGAICNLGSSATVDNNIFTGNSSQYGNGAGILDYGSAVNASYNLYYQNLDAGATEDDCNQCVTNTNAIAGSNPLLAALASYGGPTQTVLPQPGSPAICAGSTSLIPSGVTTDQRGFSRTTTYNSTACVDLGAVQTRYTAVAFSSSSYSGVLNQAVNPAPVVTVTENGQNIGGVPITLAYSGTGSPTGLGPVTTAGGTGATFSSLTATAAAQGTLTVSLPITGSGNSVQPPALTASATLNIHSTAQTITFVAPSPLTYGNAPLTLTATGGGSGNQVIFSLDAASTPGAAVLRGNTLTITGVGTIVIDANQAAGAGYTAAAQVQQKIVVNPAPLTITASSPAVIYGSPVPTNAHLRYLLQRGYQRRVDQAANLRHGVHGNQRSRLIALHKLLERRGRQLHIHLCQRLGDR
jgi:predicted outer membrane repeat protein